MGLFQTLRHPTDPVLLKMMKYTHIARNRERDKDRLCTCLCLYEQDDANALMLIPSCSHGNLHYWSSERSQMWFQIHTTLTASVPALSMLTPYA